MEDRVTELAVREMVERLATTDPVPGGGSAAALAGAMAAALVRMVVSLTADREAGLDPASDIGRIASAATTWQSELLNLADLDANAYAAVVRARRLPRDTDLERQTRDVQVAAAVREATRAPLQTLNAASAVLELAEQLAPLGSARAISDVGVAAMLAAASARGAALNVQINLQAVTDRALRAEADEALSRTVPGLYGRLRGIDAKVAERLA
jgi:methenyltetrahydrofolate cyclohydrolase